MWRGFFKKITEASARPSIYSRPEQASKRYEHDQAGWIKPGASPETLQSMQDGGLRSDHPPIYDPMEVRADNKVPVKAQATGGQGDPKNPSALLHNSIRVDGSLKEERIVTPTKPVLIDIEDISPIVRSETMLNDPYTKHNMSKAGVPPSDFIDGTKYVPPGQIGEK